MARLIRTEKEVEGRYEEVWVVVEEDPLEQWPEGPLTVVGRPAPRKSGFERVRGEARYTADIRLPGMLQAAILRSPHAHARVKRIDLAPALALPGVRAALGPGEAHGLEEEAGFSGAPVAAVAADTFRQALAAAAAIDVEWEELDVVLDPDEAVRREQFTADPRHYERGDVDKALAQADVVVEATYRTQTVLHNSMETHQAICEWAGDVLNVYISTQFIWGIRESVAETLELPQDKVRVVCEYMGGGFGSKNSPDEYTYVAAELAKRTGRPVRCALTRREEHTAAGNRNATIQRLRAGARSDGTIVALDGEFTNAVGWSGWNASTEGPMKMLYDCENVRTVTFGAKVNTPPMKAFRAPGFVEGTFGLECLVDELAAKLDMDPLELRRRNYATTNDGTPLSSKNLEDCYRLAEPHWERRHEVRSRSDAIWKRGVGMASQIWYGGGGPPSYAWVRIGSDGRATVITAMQDIGTGTRTAMAQIAAEELRLPLDRVDVVLGDSARGPYASISAGSSTLPSMGPAVRAAAADAREQVEDIAEQRGMPKDAPVEEVVDLLEDAQILGKGARGPNPAGMSVLTFGVHVVEVAVDVETGEVVVERVAAIHDVGRIVNPLGASSQVEGGIIQGIGHTLSEERLLDPETGRVLTSTLESYRMPTIADVPEILCEFVDKPDTQLTNLGSKGLGEPPIVPIAAAIANAIRDATGADVHELPISREEMLRALREAEARQKEKRGAPAAV
ncbi:MAG TPA: xanthine dehydrogenase family protein molybdopterin-binding subunit [Gaiellaceae bacterium]|nr:xanthine dehydrogenase family protein molybdopterin-binding subunit [Gaiellaceae bacterium]